MAMFDSPVEAVRCAIVIQQTMVGRNASLPSAQRILYRIGIHLGDVIVEPDDIYGEGVNIAARLEGIARPGDLFISGGVYEQIKNKLVCAYQALGDRQVKNITDPVSVYRVLPDPSALMHARKGRRTIVFVALSVLMIAALGSATGFLHVDTTASVGGLSGASGRRGSKDGANHTLPGPCVAPASPALPPVAPAPPAASSPPMPQAAVPNGPSAAPKASAPALDVPQRFPMRQPRLLMHPPRLQAPATFPMRSPRYRRCLQWYHFLVARSRWAAMMILRKSPSTA